MHVLIWKFRVRAGQESKFFAAYGSDGRWAQLFSRASGFSRTELARNFEDNRIFYTFDFWQSQQAFDKFRQDYGAEYEALDRQLAELTDEEDYIGPRSEVPAS